MLQGTEFSSTSKTGKKMEQVMNIQFNVLNQESERVQQEKTKKMSIDAITGKLVKEMDGMSKKWSNERDNGQAIDLLL